MAISAGAPTGCGGVAPTSHDGGGFSTPRRRTPSRGYVRRSVRAPPQVTGSLSSINGAVSGSSGAAPALLGPIRGRTSSLRLARLTRQHLAAT